MPTDEQRTLRPFLQFPLWAAAKGGDPRAHYYKGRTGNFGKLERACAGFEKHGHHLLIPGPETKRCAQCERIANGEEADWHGDY